MMSSLTDQENSPLTRGKGRRISRFRLVLSVLMVLQALVLIYCIWLFSVPLTSYYWEGEELESRYGVYLEDFLGEYGNGYYLDNSLHADEDDEEWLEADGDESVVLKISSPAVDLRRGSYEITVRYSSSYLATYSSISEYSTYYVTAQKTSMGFSASEDGELTYVIYSPIAVEAYQVQTNYLGTGYLFVSSVAIQETSDWKRVQLALVLFLFLLIDVVLLTQHNPQKRPDPPQRMVLCVLFCTILFASAPLFIYYIYGGSDLGFHLNRIEAIKTALLDGQFPVRISSWWCYGYGYASSVLYGDIFLYLPALLRIIGFTVQDSYKIFVFLVNTATCLISYYCFHKISGRRSAALTGAVLYTLSVYRLINVYMRAAAGEYTAMIFLPLVAYGLWRIYTEPTDAKDYRHNWVPAVLGYTGIILSHVISTVLAGFFTIVLCLVLLKKTLCPARLRQLLKVVMYTLLLTLWFVVPFLDYYRFEYEMTTREMFGRMHANSLTLNELLNLFPDASGTVHNISDTMNQGVNSYTVGGGLLAAGGVWLLLRLGGRIKESRLRRTGDLALGFSAAALFMCTTLFPWDFLQQQGGILETLTQNIQFPWRILGIASLTLSLVGVCLAAALREEGGKENTFAVSTVVLLLALISGGYMMSAYCRSSGTSDIQLIQTESDLSSTNVGMGEYLPAGTDKGIFVSDEPETEGRLAELSCLREGGTITVSCLNETDSETYVDVPFLYYKGYHALDSDTGEELVIVAAESNKVRVIVPAGYSGTFRVRFEEPWYWRISEAVSALMLLAVPGTVFAGGKRSLLQDLLAKLPAKRGGKEENNGADECLEHV